MKPLTWDAINPITGKKFAWDDKNLRWGSPSTYLEPGDAGFVPYPEQNQPPPKPTKTKHRIYMASNPTPDSINELLAAGEDLCDGLDQHAATVGILQNTAAATTLHTALSVARNGVGNALNATKAAKISFENAKDAFRARYRGTIGELEQKLDAEDPRWYDFGLIRPADAATPGQPSNVVVSAAGPGALLVVIDGARRANSFNYYRKIIGTDAEPVKATNTEGTQYTLTGLPAGATVEVTVTGVNDAGEGPASVPVSAVVG